METLQLDKTRFHFIWRGAVVGVIAGFVISLFRLCIENMLKIVKIVFSAGFEKPIWMLLLFLFFIVAWLVNAKFIKDEPNISGSGIPQVEGQLEGELELSWKSIFFPKVDRRGSFNRIWSFSWKRRPVNSAWSGSWTRFWRKNQT